MLESEVREKFAAELVGDQEQIWKAFQWFVFGVWLSSHLRGSPIERTSFGEAYYYPRHVDRFIEWVRFGKVPEFD